MINNRLNERLLKIGMNNPGGLWGLSTRPYRPLPDLISTRRKETNKIQRLPHRDDNFWQRRLRAKVFAFLICRFVGSELCEAFFERYGDWNDGVAVCVFFYPGGDFGEVSVLLADVVFFAKVDEVDDGLCGEEEEWVYYFDLWIVSQLCRLIIYTIRWNREGIIRVGLVLTIAST